MLPLIEQTINQQIQKAIEKEIDKLVAEIKKKVPQKMLEIKRDVFQSYKIIVSGLIENYFIGVYGDTFDLKSLQDSLIYIPGVNIKPSISYDPSIFRFNDKLIRERNKFNQNARETIRKNRKLVNPEFYTETGGFSDFYNTVGNDDYDKENYQNEEDYMEDIMIDFEELVPVNGDYSGGIFHEVSLEDTYQRAIAKATEGFNVQYQNVIRPRIEKKYGISVR